jgi:nitric oxide reductase subunit B
VTAHYSVEGHNFYGIPLADVLPYAVTRTWHLQLSVFWIATAWLATGIFIGPMISGKEPKFQVWGVNFLFLCALIIVVGSMFGEWAGVQQWFDDLTMNFWFGHQGYEFIELGRFWQAFLFVGLMLWVGLVARAIWPVLKQADQKESRSLYIMLLLSALSIGLFYGAGLMWGENTHISVVEYWRWWVVHLWVEGFFEVFATLAISFLFVKLGLVGIRTATSAVIFATIVFMFGGILGTAHHWYFTGTPISTIAYGAMFSALEVVPLVLVGFEAYGNYRHTRSDSWLSAYKWPILFFVAVSFWNLVGAGLFGFLINPPLTLYYTQGLNTTPTHGHAALFGVYGMLALGLMLFCLRGLSNPKAWDDRLLKWAFWSLNVGLLMMVTMSLLPVGILQTIASVNEGLWYARSAEFLQQPIIHTLVWMRVPGDIVFGFGGLFIALFVAKLWLKRNA